MQEKVRQLQDRETEAIEMLSTLEKEHGALTAEQAAVIRQLSNLQQKSRKTDRIFKAEVTSQWLRLNIWKSRPTLLDQPFIGGYPK